MMKSLNHNSNNNNSLTLTFSLLILLLSFSLTNAQNGATSTAIDSIVFTQWRGAPNGWTKYDTGSLTVTPDSPMRWVKTQTGTPRQFNFLLLFFTFKYTHTAPAPGTYVIRFGIYERLGCSKRRGNQMVVNGVSSRIVNAAEECGCGEQYFLDVQFDVADDLVIDISSDRLNGFWAPTLSNFELFRLADAPPAFSCSGSAPASASPSTSIVPAVPTTVSPSASLPAPPPPPPPPTSTGENGASITAVNSIVFTLWKNAPRGWSKYDTSSLTVTPNSPMRWVKTDTGAPRQFNFFLVFFSFKYIHTAPAPGTYVIRFGIFERKVCSKRRGIQMVVNGVSSRVANGAEECGCGEPFFLDVQFDVAADLVIDISSDKLNGFWAPALSNFELFRLADAPAPFSCSGTPIVSSAASVAASASAASAVSASASAAAASASPSTSIAPSLSTDASTSAAPSVSATSSSSVASTPSPSSSTESSVRDVNVDIQAGITTTSEYLPPGTTQTTYVSTPSNPISTSNPVGLPGSSFLSMLEGSEFTYTFNLPPGSYNIILGFIENQEDFCTAGARVFHVLINSNMRLESFDIFSSAGCRTALVERFLRQTVDALDPQPLTITFQGISGLAAISHIRIRPSGSQCVPVTTDADITDDHLAHSVPGEYPSNGQSSYVDNDGDGFVNVFIDGSGSHTHFSYGNKNGRVTSWTWIIPETGKVVSTKQSFTRTFPLGTTRLRLVVIDDACSEDESETSITVTGRMQQGLYCYYYNGLTDLPLGGTLLDFPRPSFAAVSNSLNFASFPNFDFKNTQFVARCTFFINFEDMSEATDIRVDVGNSGIARVYRGADLILDTDTSVNATTSTSSGLQQYELLYQRLDLSATPRLALRINGSIPFNSIVSYDQSTVLPILTGIDPNTGRITGGSNTKLSGYGLYQPLTVSFGSQNVTSLTSGATAKQAFVQPPASAVAGPVEVRVTSNAGLTSNPVVYSYGSTCDPVAFRDTDVKLSNGQDPDLGLPTAVTTWSDGKLYIGTRLGVVRALSYDIESLTVTDVCHSEVIRDSRYVDWRGAPSNRSILGIIFDPKDKIGRPYLSVSTLFWQRQATIKRTNPLAWSNGAVVRLKPSTPTTLANDPKQCLQFDETIVRNLPVADGDHSVNELLFNQDGDLLIAVGGNTNAGLPYAPLGGNWESYFSGSVVVAKTSSKSNFNGDIDYTTPENLRTAIPKTDHVDIYATGVRNMFAMTIARNGKVYGADMGPNCRFGNASSSCDEYVESEAAQRSTTNRVTFPGKAIVGNPGECRYGDTRRDKLLQIKKGKFYGHSNIQRAIATNRLEECAWIDPDTDKTGKPAESPAPSYYEPRMSHLLSPMTALREYGSNLFCGRLRYNLIASRYKGRGTWRIRLKNDGAQLNGGLERFETLGGLRVEENVHGDLLFPKLYPDGKGIYVMRPITAARVGLMVVNALPFRHGRQGGTTLLIGGWGFEDGASVTVGQSPCRVVSRTEREIRCIVPPAPAAGARVDVTVEAGGIQNVLPQAVLYMNV